MKIGMVKWVEKFHEVSTLHKEHTWAQEQSMKKEAISLKIGSMI